MQKKTTFPLLALSSALALALGGCGGGGDDATPPPPASASVTVSPSLGKFSTGTPVRITTLAGALLGSGTIAANGTALVNIGSHTGAYVVEVTGDGTATYFDEATGQNVVFPSGASLTAVAPAGTSALGVTPLSDAARRQLAAAAGGLAAATGTTIQTANATVAAAFGLGDVLTPPTLVSSSTGGTLQDTSADRYALVLAAIAHNGAPGAAAHEIAKDLARDFADGALDGQTPPSDTAPLTAVVVTDFITNFNDSLRDAAADFADAATKERINNEVVVVNPDPTPVDTSLAAGIAAARKAISDVRVSASLAQSQLRDSGVALSTAIREVEATGRYGIEHLGLIEKGASFFEQMSSNQVPAGAVFNQTTQRWQIDFGFTATKPPMRCRSDVGVTDPTQITYVKCTYLNTQRKLPDSSQWSRFAFKLVKGANTGELKWDAFKEESNDGSYDDGLPIVAFGTDTDGVLKRLETTTGGELTMKGDVPFGFYQADGTPSSDKHAIDLSAVLTSSSDAQGLHTNTGSAKGTITRVVGSKQAVLELVEGSTITFREVAGGDEVVYGNFKLKGTVGAYVLAGEMALSDATVLPATGSFTGSLTKMDGTTGTSVAEVTASVTLKALDPVNDLDAGTVSLAAKVTATSGTVVQLAIGAERATAGSDTVTVSVTHKLGERSVTLTATLVAGELSGPVTISNADGISVALSRNASTGMLEGSIKKGELVVGTVSGNMISFKDGSTESLG